MRTRSLVLILGVAVLTAACGSTGASTASSGGSIPSAQATVSMGQVSGVGRVLTDSQGHTLYTPAQEANGTIMCTGSCIKIWIPLAPPASGSPTKASGVSGKLGVTSRPDGTMQVTIDGAPLYRFYLDTSAGSANGNGVSDGFDGTRFTWQAVTGTSSAGTGSGGSNGTGSNATSGTSNSGSSGYHY